jgi:S-adenosyl-L-methionine hydrolase (adenosine-forming)
MIITLTTDFGSPDSFAGTMKGVILGIAPTVQIVDLAHGVAAGDVRAGAFALMTAAPYFPAGTIHVAVIDPGVGSARKAIAIRSQHALFLGPDNGVLSWAVREETHLEVRSLENSEMILPRVSNTFHGRDLFAPAAAWLATQREFGELGPEVSSFQQMAWPSLEPVSEGWRTEVVHVDAYGNAITAFPAERAGGVRSVMLSGGQRIPFERFYAAVPDGSPLAVVGSSGFVEIAINRGDAAKKLGLRPGSQIVIA